MKTNVMKTEKAVPEISRQQALANLGGNTALYDKYLSMFKTNYINSSNEISCMLQDGRIKDACILIHSVKGLSGTLGLTKLFSTASELEIVLRSLTYARMENPMYDEDRDSLYSSLLNKYDKCLHEI